MTSCDNHETSTSFTSTKMKEEEKKREKKNKTSDLSFLQKLGQRPSFAERKTLNLLFLLFSAIWLVEVQSPIWFN